MRLLPLRAVLGAALFAGACARPASVPAPVPASVGRIPAAPTPLDAARQLIVVTTTGWDTTGGVLRRYERDLDDRSWRAVGAAVPVVIGRTGLAWGDDTLARAAGRPAKHEGDGRSPAGIFPLDTLFGFANTIAGLHMPYAPLTNASECVDDVASVHYNTVVNRGTVPRVDWKSAEPMRRIEQYREGVIVGYNAAPVRAGRGSCIFLHIWAGPGTSTAGCTAMPASELAQIVRWLDTSRAPMLVQLPAGEYARLRTAWQLP